MARSQKRTNQQPQTTAQQLGSLIKSARDIMRKDKGLNGDLDRLPMLTWIMFLKFLDDMELGRAEEAALAGEAFHPAIEPPYRWRDWAAVPGITGDELLAFVNQDECTRPDGTPGPGLLAYLRSLQSDSGRDRRDVVANVFRGVTNRMVNGYLLRDVIDKVNGIHFTSSQEIHTLGHLYESMLRELRDAAGDSGEIYTPRPVVKFMVEALDPRLGESMLDPAVGTGGFAVEVFEHLRPQADTVEKGRILQEQSIYGQEAKSLPYLLALMNLLLHGLEFPNLTLGNSLAVKVTRDRRPRAGGHHPDQPALRRRGGGRHQGQLPGGQADGGDGAALPAAHHAQAEAAGGQPGQAGAGGRGGAQRHALRRRRGGAHQGGAAQGVQPAHRSCGCPTASLRRTRASPRT